MSGWIRQVSPVFALRPRQKLSSTPSPVRLIFLVIAALLVVSASVPGLVRSQSVSGFHFDAVIEINALVGTKVELTASFVENSGTLEIIGGPYCRTLSRTPIKVIAIDTLECYSKARLSDSYIDIRVTWKEHASLGRWDIPILTERDEQAEFRVYANRGVEVLQRPTFLNSEGDITGHVIDKGWVAGKPTPEPGVTKPSEFPPVGRQEPTAVPAQPQAPQQPSTCTDRGIPVLTSPLTFSPPEVSVGTDVTFSFTIKNTGCNPFAPVILAIGGHYTADIIDDPMQDRQFTLGSGESRTVTHTDSRDVPGTFKHFVVFQDQEGDWIPVPDTAGAYPESYQTVSEAATVPADTAGEGDNQAGEPTTQPANAADQGLARNVQTTSEAVTGTCTDSTRPVIQDMDVSFDANDLSNPKQVEIAIFNPGCETFAPPALRVVDLVQGQSMVTLYNSDAVVIEPMSTLVLAFDVPLDQPGEHSMWVEFEVGDAENTVAVLLNAQGDYGVLIFGVKSNGDLGFDEQPAAIAPDGSQSEGSTDPQAGTDGTGAPPLTENNSGWQFEAGCNYSWLDGSWSAFNCIQNGAPLDYALLGPALDQPVMDGCVYFYDGYYFYMNPGWNGCSWLSNDTVSPEGYEAGCHYVWSSTEGWTWMNCGGEAPWDELGPPVSAPEVQGCVYFYDGSYFYQNLVYGCDHRY